MEEKEPKETRREVDSNHGDETKLRSYHFQGGKPKEG